MRERERSLREGQSEGREGGSREGGRESREGGREVSGRDLRQRIGRERERERESLVLCRNLLELSFFTFTVFYEGGGPMPERLQSSGGDGSKKVERHWSRLFTQI